MRDAKPISRSILWALVLAATVFLACGAARAQVRGYVVINPIAVCNSSGICPTFGVKCGLTNGVYGCTQSNSPSAANQTTQTILSTPIGFVDSDNNRNLIRATWLKAGLDVVFLPVQQWNSDNNNTNPWAGLVDAVTTKTFSAYSANTNYQTAHTVNVACNDLVPGTNNHVTVLTSPDFQALTQRKVCDDHGGPMSSNIVAAANPPPAPTGGGKPVPLAINGCSSAFPCSKDPITGKGNSNAVDLLFITTISNPTAAGSTVTNGLSWINHNGVLVTKSAMVPSVPGGSPLFGVFTHEIGHGLSLSHTTDSASTNLMTVGGPRTEASTSGCAPPGITYGRNTNTFGGILYDLAYAPSVPITCTPAMNAVTDDMTSDQAAAVQMSGFVNLSLAATANAGGGDLLTAATKSGKATTSSNSKGGIPFQVDTFGGGGEGGAAIGSVIFALTGLDFQGNTPANETGGSDGLHIIKQLRLNGNEGLGNLNCTKPIGLASGGTHCLQLFFTQGAFTVDKFITFTLKIAGPTGPLTTDQLAQLAGTGFSVLADNGNGGSTYATTTTFESVGGVLQPADSRFPDLSIPNQVNASTFVGATQTPCAPFNSAPGDCKKGELPSGQGAGNAWVPPPD